MDEFKKCINEISKTLDRTVGLIENPAQQREDAAAGSDPEGLEEMIQLASTGEGIIRAHGRSFARLLKGDADSPIVYVEGTDSAAKDVLSLLLHILRDVQNVSASEMERQGFLKNILLENELPGDIPLKARDFKISYFLLRMALQIRFSEAIDPHCAMVVRSVLGQGEDYLLTVDEYNMVLLLDCSQYADERIQELCEQLLQRFAEDGRQIHIGVGLRVENLKDVARSYQEASLALIVGRIFNEEEQIMWYNRLGLGRLIYQLPPTLCRMFLAEVFKPDTYESLDPETLLTIEKFFENNLNGSETSRQLFVHRNTLVYRLDKVQKITGLDLRNFDDAVLFKLASMVRKYLESLQEVHEAENFRKTW